MNSRFGNTACGFVWSGVSTDTMGRLRPCCTINSPLTDSVGEPYKIDRIGDFERFWKSSIMQEIRQAGLENKWHKLCFKCQEQEEAGSSSQRMIYNYLLPKEINNIPKVRVFNLLLSNKCNMKCRMCSPKNSHLIGRESQAHDLSELWGNDVWGNDQTITYNNPVSIDDNAMIELIDAYHDTIEEIQFAGGEPFLSDTQHKILKKLIELGVSEKITITYNTNGTIPMEPYYDMWSKFKKVTIAISLEAIGDLANYIRYPTNWNNIERIMKSLDAISNDIIQVKIDCLVQALNVLQIHNLIEWLGQYKNICPLPNFRTLVSPKHLHLRNIPQELRIISAEKIENTLSKISNHDWLVQFYIDRTKKVIHHIKTEPDVKDISQFIKFNKTLDGIRKTNLFDVLPELKPYVKGITNV